MSFKNSFSWLGFLKIIPLAVGFMSGILGIIQQVILLYSTNPNPVWQEKVFWSGVWIAFVISSFIAWAIEHQKRRKLEKHIEQLYSKLDIETKEIFLTVPKLWDSRHTTQFLTFVFDVTNQKPEVNTIKKCNLLIDSKNGVVEGKLEDNTFIKKAGFNNYFHLIEKKRGTDIEGSQIVFSQGISQDYSVTFKLMVSDDIFDKEDNYADKDFTLEITDSYNRIYKIIGKTPTDLEKKMSFLKDE